MGIEEMVQIEEQADEFMSKAPEVREKLLYIAVLRTDRKVSLIEQEGCAKFCYIEPVKPSIIDRWTPAAMGTLITSVLVGLLEFFRASSHK